jgi:hypothetical protein
MTLQFALGIYLIFLSATNPGESFTISPFSEQISYLCCLFATSGGYAPYSTRPLQTLRARETPPLRDRVRLSLTLLW